MKEGPNIARTAALIGDPARANMLSALMAGKALTASELAREAMISPSTASAHLAKLVDGGLLALKKQGRHRYFAIANEEVALVLGGLMGLAEGAGKSRTRTGPRDEAMRKARSCYNHLAGELGTRMFDSLCTNGHLAITGDGLALTASGLSLCENLGMNPKTLNTPKCRECLDWSERRSHLAGSLGRAFLSQFETLGWAKRDKTSRAILFTTSGERKFHEIFPFIEPPKTG